MLDIWRRNMAENARLVREDAGPGLVMVVSGSEADRTYWYEHLADTRRDVFRRDGRTAIVSVYERSLRGNYMGTFHAWAEARRQPAFREATLPGVGLMTMVFGKGTRLSPFTQALGNRKPAFPTPLRGEIYDGYLRTVDLANLYANGWLQALADGGFRGLVVKWGDEAVVPGITWCPAAGELRDLDAVRFVWETEITPELARDKEWVVLDARTGLMRQQFARQEAGALRARVAALGQGECRVGVNLGSLAISYQFLDAALEVLGEDVYAVDKWANWDPYAWIALCCRDEEEWRAQAAYEDGAGQRGLRALEAHYPDFYPTVARIRAALEARTGRPMAVGALDFGTAYWCDLGLHHTLRQTLEAMTGESNRGQATRDLFRIPHHRDRWGNLALDSQIAPGAEVRDSVLVDTIVTDPASVIHGAVVIGGRHRRLNMPQGGCALFCAADDLRFDGPHAVAFRAMGAQIRLVEGERYTTLLLPEGPVPMVASEAMVSFQNDNYGRPVLGNQYSFEEAGERMAAMDGRALEANWRRAWAGWLD
jgi:hypothetical protein